MPEDDNAVAGLVQQLTGYLRDNPLACDTQEGIARWWLPPGAVCDDQTLSRALRRMEGLRLVEPLRAADERVRYRRIAPPANGRDGTQVDERGADERAPSPSPTPSQIRPQRARRQ